MQSLQGGVHTTLQVSEPLCQPSAVLCLYLPHSPHQLVAVLENITGEDPAGGIHHRLLHDVVVTGGRGQVQWYLGNRAR